MKHISRSSRFYQLMLALTCRQRFFIIASFLSCIVVSWFVLLYQPLVKRTQLHQRRFDESIANNTIGKDLHTKSGQQEETIAALENQWQEHTNENKKSADHITTLAKLAHQSTVCIDSCSLERAEEKQNFTIVPLSLSGHGTVPQISDFLTKVFETYRSAAPTQIALEQMKENIFQFNFHINFLKPK